MLRHIGEIDARNKENNGRHRGDLRKESGGAARSEDRLRASSEGGAHVGAFSGLEKNHNDHKNADDEM